MKMALSKGHGPRSKSKTGSETALPWAAKLRHNMATVKIVASLALEKKLRGRTAFHCPAPERIVAASISSITCRYPLLRIHSCEVS